MKKPDTIELIPIRETTRVPDSECPTCGRPLSAASHSTDLAMPSPGDVSLCLYCGEMLEFDALLHSVRLSEAVRRNLITKYPDEWAYMLEMQVKFRKAAGAFVIFPEQKVQ